MKRFLPIVAVLGVSSLLVGCDAMMNKSLNNSNVEKNLKQFETSFNNLSNLTTEALSRNIKNYKLNLSIPENATLVSSETNFNENETFATIQDENDLEITENTPSTLEIYPDQEINNNNEEVQVTDENTNTETDNTNENNENNQEESNEINEDLNDVIDNEINKDLNEISTLYSLTADIDQSCNEYCQLKKSIENAITETLNIIEKVKNKEIELTDEQKIILKEQSSELANISKQLNRKTNELTYSLSEVDNLQFSDYGINEISLKYILLLDNMIKSNEMLNNSLNSLNLINNMINLRLKNIPPNNQGQILYGFQSNNDPAIFKSFYKDKNGNWIENSPSENETIETTDNNTDEQQTINETEVKSNTNIDSYNNTLLKSNIDTYRNNYNSNIDTFFNTALLDNEFMYGNRMNNFGGMYGGFNPYMQQYSNYEQNNKYNQNLNRSIDNTNPNYDDSAYSGNKSINTPNKKKSHFFKKPNFKSNIDTYRDENTPTLRTKLSKLKSVLNLKKPKNDIINPIYRYDSED